MKYLTGIEKLLKGEMQNPSDEFIRLLASRVYGGRLTSNVVEQFKPIVKRAFSSFVNDNVQERLQSALSPQTSESSVQEGEASTISDIAPDEKEAKVVTTEEELQAFYIVKSLVGEVVSTDRVSIRDTQSYCGVLLDDNNRKPICRLFLDSKQKYIGLLDENKNVTKRPINSLDEIYSFKDDIKRTVGLYLQNKEKVEEPS